MTENIRGDESFIKNSDKNIYERNDSVQMRTFKGMYSED